MSIIYTVVVVKEDPSGTGIHKKVISIPDFKRACHYAAAELQDKLVISIEIIRAWEKL